MEIIIDRANSRGHANHDWLDTYHTFSFADYYNSRRMHFGALRVLNDDKVAPGKGFQQHPHENMEIVSIPLKGHLEHGDSTNNQRVITVGDIQVMSAGSGILHSEINHSDKEPVEFLQIWVFPKHKNNIPRYNDYSLQDVLKKNELVTFISPDGKSKASLDQDAWFSMGKLDKGVTVDYKLHGPAMGVYVFVIEGKVKIGEEELSRRDGMGISRTESFQVEALESAEVLLMEVPMI